MIITWALICIALILFFLKAKTKPLRFSKFLMFLFIGFTFYEIINYITKIAGNGIVTFTEQYKPVVNLETNIKGNNSDNPDIYYLVFDSYTNSNCFKRAFKFDNSSLDTLLKKEDFYIVPESKSNYFDSPVSIAATLNMNYLPKAATAKTENELTYFCGLRNLEENNLWNFLEKRNYTIHNLSVFNTKKYKSPLNTIYFGNSDEDLLIQKTILNTTLPPLKSFFNKAIPKTVFDEWGDAKQDMLQDTLIIKNELRKTLNKQTENPVFFYSHCLLPHPPYVLDSLGRETNPVPKNGYDPEGYLQQAVYVKGMILRFVKEIKEKSRRPYVIIVQGDHGYRYFKKTINEKECFNILNAWYFSDQDYANLYPTISSVNTYRVVLNKYFKTKLPMLKDTSYFPLVYSFPY